MATVEQRLFNMCAKMRKRAEDTRKLIATKNRRRIELAERRNAAAEADPVNHALVAELTRALDQLEEELDSDRASLSEQEDDLRFNCGSVHPLPPN